MLARYRHHGGGLTRAAFLSARNDALANVAIIVAGLVTGFIWPSAWPDLIVGLGIAAMNADAAREVWERHGTSTAPSHDAAMDRRADAEGSKSLPPLPRQLARVSTWRPADGLPVSRLQAMVATKAPRR